MLQFQCPHCGGPFQILPTMAGQQFACPHCHGVVLIPDASQLAPPANLPEPPVIANQAPSNLVAPPSHAAPVEHLHMHAPPVMPAGEIGTRKVRRLTPEERAARRTFKNVALIVICALVLLGLMLFLLRSGPL